MILIGLGANIPGKYGSPEQSIAAARPALEARGIFVSKASRLWLSAPVPDSDQPWYRNAVMAVQTDFAPANILRLLKQVERAFGRIETARNAPRVLDLDLLAYGDEVITEGDLQVPHPRMHERGFVLYPIADVNPQWVHPVLQVAVGELISRLPEGQKLKPLDVEAA